MQAMPARAMLAAPAMMVHGGAGAAYQQYGAAPGYLHGPPPPMGHPGYPPRGCKICGAAEATAGYCFTCRSSSFLGSGR